jgi:hypothetical protein
MNTTTSYLIPAGNFARLQERIAGIAKRAARVARRGDLVDATPIALVKVGEQRKTVTNEVTGAKTTVIYFEVAVTGTAPKLAGWTFVATMQHEEAGVILRTVPTVELPAGTLDAYRACSPACDHCQTERRRNDTFVLRADDGRTKQVGRSCLADFLGGLSPAGAARMAEILAACGQACEDEASGGGSGRVEQVDDLGAFLVVVATVVRLSGWMSRGAARLREGVRATADLVMEAMHPHPMSEASIAWAREVAAARLDVDVTAARCALDAAEALDAGAQLSDYEHNLRVIALGGFVTARLAGLAASILPWYDRELAKARELSRTAESKHLGTVGLREVFEALTLVRVMHFDTDFGTLHLHRFEDAAGNVLVWKTSSESWEPGRVYTVKATVKKHDDYRGTAQTVITRVAEHVAKVKKPRAKKAAPAPVVG